ncbi:MAG: 7-cyano-7-deazaguanine synthase QueC [Armatimonadetes bacterium]|nr:7-cyano-7-deazaguanine synthase QueC [Armatimonadota bacterium]
MKSVILLSSGLDSLVNLALAKKETQISLALTFDYKQKALRREIAQSRKICKYYKISHKVLKIPWLSELGSALTGGMDLPALKEDELDNLKKTSKSAKLVWVPNRNSLFINIAACFAEKLKCSLIVAGFNKEEAQTFPDNSLEFVKRINQSLKFSTLKKIKVKSFTQNLTKKEIIKLAIKLKLPFQYLWSCYESGKIMCGICESCLRLKRAIRDKNLKIKFLN